MKELNLSKGRALVVVAHPDDETIWMGGTILRYKNIDWTIFVLCRKNDPERCPRFLRVVKVYHVCGIIFDLEDDGKFTLKESLPEIEKRILHGLRGKKFDYIFTHGANGEYGHLKHKGAHRAVRKMVKEGKLISDNLFFFAYGSSLPQADFYVKLSAEEFKIKKNIVKNLYGFGELSFESQSCQKIETFNKFKQP